MTVSPTSRSALPGERVLVIARSVPLVTSIGRLTLLFAGFGSPGWNGSVPLTLPRMIRSDVLAAATCAVKGML